MLITYHFRGFKDGHARNIFLAEKLSVLEAKYRGLQVIRK